MKLLLLSLLISSSLFAHGDRDWREDYQAYLSVDYELTPIAGHKSKKISRLDMNFFREKLSVLTGVTPFNGSTIANRKDSVNLDLARAFLKAEYEKLGFTVSFHPFSRGQNFIAEKKGINSPEKVLILSSHIDSVNNRGANDNGTGTIGLLAVAQELAKSEFDYTVRILGFDKEETGLVGSDAYVATLPGHEVVLGNINFEMMGVNARKDGAFHVIDCNKENSVFLTSEIRNSISELGLPLSIVKACTDRSDHASFWRKKLPAVVISENFFGGDADPCYHARCDVMDERLDYSYMGNILEAVLNASEKILRKVQK
jgi:hypothetical protein